MFDLDDESSFKTSKNFFSSLQRTKRNESKKNVSVYLKKKKLSFKRSFPRKYFNLKLNHELWDVVDYKIGKNYNHFIFRHFWLQMRDKRKIADKLWATVFFALKLTISKFSHFYKLEINDVIIEKYEFVNFN
jgi:hypothetical protein